MSKKKVVNFARKNSDQPFSLLSDPDLNPDFLENLIRIRLKPTWIRKKEKSFEGAKPKKDFLRK